MKKMFFALLLPACSPEPAEKTDGPLVVPWSADLPELSASVTDPRGFVPLRAYIHLHTPYSHDACDGAGYADGVLDEACLADLRAALCRLHADLGFLTDHPSYAAGIPWEEWLLSRDEDDVVIEGDDPVANRIQCDDGHEVVTMPGIEDDLMPVGLSRHAADPGDAADAVYSGYDADAVAADIAAGATVLVAHTEGHTTEKLASLADSGLSGLEVFNLHAMLDPDIRESMGLDPLGWTTNVAPFTSPDGTAEPDLMFLGFFEEQIISVQRWDELLASHRMTGVLGTDAHQNVMPWDLRDGERADGYRRMMRWFSNTLLARSDARSDAREALAEGRLYGAFEVFGMPDGVGFWYDDPSGEEIDMGGTGTAGGTLHVRCPVLSESSPQDGSGPPDVTVTLFRDGQPWQSTCGDVPDLGPGVYRARFDIVPTHLAAWLGADPSPYIRAFPWVYTNVIRVD